MVVYLAIVLATVAPPTAALYTGSGLYTGRARSPRLSPVHPSASDTNEKPSDSYPGHDDDQLCAEHLYLASCVLRLASEYQTLRLYYPEQHSKDQNRPPAGSGPAWC